MKGKMTLPKLCAVFGGCILLYQDMQAQRVTPPAYSSGVKINYIRAWDAIIPMTDAAKITSTIHIDSSRMSTQYFDALGRPVQTVIKQGSLVTGGSSVDMVSPVEYDSFGREQYKYLPFAANNTGSNTHISDGLFKLNPFQQDSAFNKGMFSDETYYYSKTIFEASPLNRVLKTFAPGNNWVGKENEDVYTCAEWEYPTGQWHSVCEPVDRSVKVKNWINTAADSVRIWNVSPPSGGAGGGFGTYTSDTFYAVGQLFKNITFDEHNKQVIEFKDKRGKVILKKVQLTAAMDGGERSTTAYTGWLSTYYIYDDRGQLRCVIQPKGVELLVANSWDMNYSSGVILSEQCFRYEYDSKGRMVMKKVPGSGTACMVYDARNRVVMSQDSLLRAAHQWLYTQYDELNRVASTGLFTDNSNYNNLSYHAVRADTSIAYPASGTYTVDTLTKTFYDDYAWRAGQGNPLSDTRTSTYDSYLLTASNTVWPYPQNAASQSNHIKGRVTGTKTKVLGTSTYIYTVTFYDDKGRLVQTQSGNISNGTDILTTQYSWAGLPLLTITKHEKGGTNTQTSIVVTKITYDDLGRSLKIEKKASNTKVNSGAMPGSWKLVVQNEYDALGKLKKKKLSPTGGAGGGPLDSLTYDYNIRGWMLGANRSYVKDTTSTANWFGFDLGYDKTAFTVNGSNKSYAGAQYNGNIGGMLWKSTGDDQLRKYDFSYDATNRLMAADFNQLTGGDFSKTAGIDFSVHGLSYDANGNILTMNQRGWKISGSETIDSLLYTYISNSNRLLNVIDRKNDTTTRLGDFRSSGAYMTALNNNKTTSATDYSYDANGNMYVDNNKDIGNIHYNHLNLPDSITVTNKGYIKYVYDAGGNKMKKITTEGSIVTTTLYLFGNYVNDTLQFLPQEEGRIRFKQVNTSLQYDYFIKDHLGNIRMVLTEEKDTAFYPAVTHETANASTENIYYENVYVGRTTRPGGFYTQGTNGDTVQLIRKTTQSIGAGKLLKVMAADKLHIKVDYYAANEATDNTGANGLDAILTVLTSLINNSSVTTGIHGGGSTITGDLNNSTPFTNFLAPQSGSGGTSMPKAYLNILFFDEQFRFVNSNSEIIQITTKGSGQTITRISGSAKEAMKNGYAYVFVSNESNNLVYFDNLQVTHERGPIIEESHYYPFGLTMAGISSKALNFGDPDSKHGYNGYEENKDLGINLYETFYRSHDPQLGRFWQLDPKPRDWESQYSAMGNNPISNVDLLGDIWLNEEDQRIANELIADINGKIASNNAQIFSLNTRMASIEEKLKETGLSDEQKDKLNSELNGINSQLNDLNFSNTALQGSIESINTLETSSQYYTFNTVGKDVIPEFQTGQSMNNSKGEAVSVNVLNNNGTKANKIHEISHAWDHDKGRVIYDNASHLRAEIQAYAYQLGYDPKSLPLTIFYLKGVTSVNEIVNTRYVPSIGRYTRTLTGESNITYDRLIPGNEYVPSYPNLWNKYIAPSIK